MRLFLSSLVGVCLLFTSLAYSMQQPDEVYVLCQRCHGENGEGKIELRAPAIAGMPEWYIIKQLKNFQKGARGGHPDDVAGLRMRPMARTLKSEAEVKAIAKLVSQLPPVKQPQTIVGRPIKGGKKYKQVCIACHGADGKGNRQLGSPPLAGASDWYLVDQLHNFKNGVRGGDAGIDAQGASMAPMAKILDEDEFRDIILYATGL